MSMNLSEKLLAKLKNKIYRTAYVAENVTVGVASQIRAMREQRDISQVQLGALMNKPQSVVSRLESVNYGKLSIQTLLDVAAAFDVALLVQFVAYPDFLRRTKDVSPNALNAASFSLDQFRGADVSALFNNSDSTMYISIGEAYGYSSPLSTDQDLINYNPPKLNQFAAVTI